MEAAKPMAPMQTGMLFLASSGRHCQLSGTLYYYYVFLPRTQPTRTPQRPPTRLDLNGQQRSPWCPTLGTAAQSSHPVCWLIVVCGSTGSDAPWLGGAQVGSHQFVFGTKKKKGPSSTSLTALTPVKVSPFFTSSPLPPHQGSDDKVTVRP